MQVKTLLFLAAAGVDALQAVVPRPKPLPLQEKMATRELDDESAAASCTRRVVRGHKSRRTRATEAICERCRNSAALFDDRRSRPL